MTFARIASRAAVVTLVAAFVAPAILPLAEASWAWALTMLCLATFCGLVGVAINGRPAGLIIDKRNRVSLSKFQAVAWSVFVLSALITAILLRLRIPNLSLDAVAIEIPPELLAAMGISVTSLAVSPVILSLKATEAAPAGAEQLTAAKLNDPVGTYASSGKVYARGDAAKAQWLDMFRGEEVSNAASPDLSKVQQFLVTIVVLTVYAASVWTMFGTSLDAQNLTTLPRFSAQMVWLVGISHAGYLAYKAAPHGPNANDPSPATASARFDEVAG